MKRFTYFTLFLFFSIVFNNCSSDSSTIKEEPNLPYTPLLSLEKCFTKTAADKLEIVTWNMEHFPKDKKTLKEVAAIIKAMNVDVLALQEIRDKDNFDKLLALLSDYKGNIMVRSDINLAYIYKTSEITLQDNPYGIFVEKEYHSPFPRRPFVLPILHKNTGLNIILVNNHLKAKSGIENENRRREASKLLKHWIDSEHPQDKIIVLGDLNDEITDKPSENVFQLFIDDAENYRFADREIAESSDKYQWSYPSWPSHIDHILITNELFSNVTKTFTYTFYSCDRNYKSVVSDHQPVCVILE